MSKAFKRFQFNDTMLEAINRIGFTHPTLVQERVIPKIMRHENTIVQSETGSGKSHSFLLPIISQIDGTKQHPEAIILAPTRELAQQLFNMTREILESYKHIKVSLFIGGRDMSRDVEKAVKSPQIIIGTPNRVLDLMKNNALNIHLASSITIDEADLMIDLGFLDSIDKIVNAMGDGANMHVFSATIPEQLKQFLKKYIGDVEIVGIDSSKNKASIHYSLVPVKSDIKNKKVLHLTQSITPYLGIIFANSKERADDLFEYLLTEGINVGLFHGGLKPRQRTQEIKKIRNLEYHWVVASDLASRGLDLDGASHVINYDIPREIEFFTHRVGRVGRGEYTGNAITLYTPEEHHLVDALENKGYVFNHEDLSKGELKPIKDRLTRKNRRNQEGHLEQKLKHKVRKPSKVKPGYKKKMKQQLETLKSNERRSYSKQKKRKK